MVILALSILKPFPCPVAHAAGEEGGRPPERASGASRASGGPLRTAQDLADLGFADEAFQAYTEALSASPSPETERAARLGIARCEWARGRRETALTAWREVAARHPESERAALLATLDAESARGAWKAAGDARRMLERRADLSADDRRALDREGTAIEAWLSLAPLVDDRLQGGPAEGWLLSHPLAARRATAGGDVALRADAGPGGAALVRRVELRAREPLVAAFDLRLVAVEPGGVIRLGLAREGAAEGRAQDRIALELRAPLAARPLDAGPPAVTLGLVARAEGAHAARLPPRGGRGLPLGAPLRARITWDPFTLRARAEVLSLEAPGRETLLESAEVLLPGPLPEGTYALGLLAPADEPAGAPASLALLSARLDVPGGAARGSGPSVAAPGDAIGAANAALANGRLAEALAAYRSLSLAAPLDATPILGLGLAARASGDGALAARAFASIARAEPEAPDLFRAVADEVAAGGTAGALVGVLEAYLSIVPEDAARSAALDRARRGLAEAIQAEPETGSGFTAEDRLRRADALLRAAEPDRALAEIEAARAQAAAQSTAQGKPDPALDARVLMARARALTAKGDAARAALDWSRAKALAPEDPAPFLGLGLLLLERARTDGPSAPSAAARPEAMAEAALSRALKLGPEPAAVMPGASAIEPDPRAAPVLDALAARATARLALGRIVDAEADATLLATLAPRDLRGHLLLAEAARRERRLAVAKAHVERALLLGPVDPALVAEVGAAR